MGYPLGMEQNAVVDERGRIVIPQAHRDRLGISAGSLVSLEDEGDRLILVHKGNAREKLLAAFAEVSITDQLVGQRQEQP